MFLAYASACGPALLDRELSTKEGAQDRERAPGRDAAGTRLPRSQSWHGACWSGAARPGCRPWVTGDSVYGDDRRLRTWLESHERAYVLAVSGKESVWLGWRQRQVKHPAAPLPADAWTRHSAGRGAQGPRWYDWCWLPWAAPRRRGARWLLVRRSVRTPTELTALSSLLRRPPRWRRWSRQRAPVGRLRAVVKRRKATGLGSLRGPELDAVVSAYHLGHVGIRAAERRASRVPAGGARCQKCWPRCR